jgi:diguanylate cyclase (GGDEF)-like protein
MENARQAAVEAGGPRIRAFLGAAGSSYAGIDLGRSKRLGGLLWLVGAGSMAVLLPLAPPTHAIGATAGWLCAIGMLILGIAGAIRLAIKSAYVTPGELLFMSYAALTGIALQEWLAGGRDTPYHQLYLLVVLFASATHPARRVVTFLVVFLAGISASGWEYGWSAAETGDAVIQIATALGLGLAVLTLMTSIRAQRVALSDEGDKARRLAELDPLTGLGNRRALAEALKSALDDPTTRSTLAVFDLNGFKSYNDRFGHPAGDALLIRLAHCLQSTVAGYGRAFRMGGDEFCILASLRPGSESWGEAGTAALSERGRGFTISASHGEVALPEEAAESEAALRLADQRLYASKAQIRPAADCQATSALLQVLAERNPELGMHVDGVTHLCVEVGHAFALDDERIECLRHAATLHDIGMAAIPDAILHKPGPLSDEEWGFMRNHTVIGERILAAAPSLEGAAHFVRASHERFDGGGYPDGLAGEDIPLESRIIGVCDAYDAMVSDRPYRNAKSAGEALAELERCAGTQFDPQVVTQFALSLLTPPVAAQPVR